jgi:hypothetical protein
MKPPEWITFGIAVIGAVLGIINTWKSLDRDRVRLNVIPTLGFTSHGETLLCVEVVNLGHLPVTVQQIGFLMRGTSEWLYSPPKFLHGERLPYRLEPRASFTAHYGNLEGEPRLNTVTKAFAKTACGRTFKGTSKALQSFVRSA